MPFLILLAHIGAAFAAAVLAGRSRLAAVLVAALAPASAAIWGLAALLDPGTARSASFAWVEGLQLGFDFELSPIAALLTFAIGSIGTLIVVYAHGYFAHPELTLGRFLATLTIFGGSMLGLVWADSVWTLFLFWEATSVTSFLLVGHKHAGLGARTAARRALMITGAGGLVLLAAMMVLIDATGTHLLSEMEPATGTAATVAAVLLVIAAATKSALVPFHVWLPGAMAAPTPVSAYLHSATMVKAGVVLIAVVSPVLGDTDAFRYLAVGLGALTMFWGAIGALRQRDAKLILAWGTVSQLGFLVLLFGIGSAKATFAGVAVLTAHAVFKAGLFMVVGEVDVRTGTRNIDELGGLAGSMPIAATVATLCGLSMAGVPPLLGFPAKEAAVEAALGLAGAERVIIGGAIIAGSVLTVAYTAHFLLGVFGPAADGSTTAVRPRRIAMTIPAGLLAVVSVLGWLFDGTASKPITRAAAALNPKADVYELINWPGATTAFFVSVAIVVAGAALGLARSRVALRVPDTIGANAADRALDDTLVFARRITARVQHGSLPVYVLTMAFVIAAASTIFVRPALDSLGDLRLTDSPGQLALAIATVVAAWGCTRVDSRIGAALALGVVGLTVTGLFVVHGAPDLVLTQLLVETVIVVGFVIGLGRLRRSFPETGARWQQIRAAVAALCAAGVAAALIAAEGAASSATAPPTERLVTEAVDEGGGNNIVNVILTDVRALDTLGEIVVLAVAALGVIALGRPALVTPKTPISPPTREEVRA